MESKTSYQNSQNSDRITPVRLTLWFILFYMIYVTILDIDFSRWMFQYLDTSNSVLIKPVREKRVILDNGVTMPILAAGTWQYNSDTAENSVYTALSAGYRHIDTAYNYDNQAGVSKGIKRFLADNPEYSKFDIFLTTKVPGCGSDGVSFENCGDDTHDIIAKNLELLNFSHIDLLLIHYPPLGDGISKGCGEENCVAIRHQWKAMQHAFLNKKARAIGVSNFCQSCINCLLSWKEIYVSPVVNQIQYHVGMSSDPEGLVSFSEAHGMVVQAYSPLGNANKELIKGQDLSNIARSNGKTIPQVALKWIVQNNVTVVTKSNNEAHMKKNLDMFSWKLSNDEMKFLDNKETPFNTPSFTCDA